MSNANHINNAECVDCGAAYPLRRAALEKRIESLFASSEPLETFGLCETYEMEDDDA